MERGEIQAGRHRMTRNCADTSAEQTHVYTAKQPSGIVGGRLCRHGAACVPQADVLDHLERTDDETLGQHECHAEHARRDPAANQQERARCGPGGIDADDCVHRIDWRRRPRFREIQKIM
jgi:hypothetical protein